MKSNYEKIGDHIRLIDERNTGLRVKHLLGLTISKQFIASVANIVGTDLENYKIIRKNQFACSTMQVRRDKKMPVALLKDIDEAIISQAYPVFEIKDINKMLPEYLMMWFSRQEFDREACFYAIGGVRGSLEWEDFCDMEIPVPDLEKQKEIVKEYNTIVNRIELNNKLIQKLEETAQAIYKRWFVDFEFPDEEGKPYKSNGGRLINSENGKIPKFWEVTELGNLVRTQYGYTASAESNNVGPKFLRITDIANSYINWNDVPWCKISQNNIGKYILKYGDILIARTGATVGYAKRIHKRHPNSVFASYLVRMIALDLSMNIYLGMSIDSPNYRDFIFAYQEGSAQPQANANLMTQFVIIKPDQNTLLKFNNVVENILDLIEYLQCQHALLIQIQNALLLKLIKVK